MSITLLEGFTLEVDKNHISENIIQDGLNSIGCISSMAASCSSVVAALNEGSTPNNKIISELSDSASTLSKLAQALSGLLSEIEMNNQKISITQIARTTQEAT